MDIKGIARNLIPFGSVKAAQDAKDRRSKTDANGDREGNGQAAGEDSKRRKLSADEIQEAVKYLEGLPGVRDNGLTVRLDQSNETVVVHIEDRSGKVVRRIPENELAFLTSNRQKTSGHLLNKTL